jgi:hypothetical protein
VRAAIAESIVLVAVKIAARPMMKPRPMARNHSIPESITVCDARNCFSV